MIRFKKEAKLAVIVTLIFVSFLWGFNFLKGRNLFSTFDYYYAVFDKVDGLMKSNQVTINGFAVGVVHDIRFESERLDKLIVEIGVNKNFRIPDNSSMMIMSDLLGSKTIALLLGNSPTMADNGAMLRDSIASDILDAVTASLLPIVNNADKLILSIDSVMHILHSTFDDDMQKSIQNIVAGVEQMIANERRKIAAIMSNFESVSMNLRNSNEDISNLISNLNEFSENLADTDLKNTVDIANNSLTQLNNMLTGINQGQGTLGKFATDDSLYLHLQQASDALDKLLVDLKENPKRYVHFSLFGRRR